MNEKNEKTEQKNRLVSLVRSVVEFFRPSHRMNPSRTRKQAAISTGNMEEQILLPPRRDQEDQPSEPSAALSHEQFRRMLEETLAADPTLARRVMWPLAGTIYPFVGGVCGTLAKNVGGASPSDRDFGFSGCNTNGNDYSFPGNVGIGTTGPLSDEGPVKGLEIVSTVSGSANYPALHITDLAAAKTFGLQVSRDATSSFQIRDINQGIARLLIDTNGNVGIGTTSPQSKLNVKGNASFTATGTVSVTINSATVTGSGTSFTTQVAIGDRISVTTGGNTYTRTVTAIASNTSLTVDAAFTVSASSLSMTVLPSLLRCENSSGNQKLLVNDEGFVGLAGTAALDNDGVGYVMCHLDIPVTDKNNEMRGYNATMRYARNNADANVVYGFTVSTSGTMVTFVSGPEPPLQFITTGAWNGLRIDINGLSYVISTVNSATQLTLTTSAGTQSNVAAAVFQTTPTAYTTGLGWDVFGYTGAVSLENMNLPSGDPAIRGQMKVFHSGLYFMPAAGPAGDPHYNVVQPAFNYLASLTAVHSTCTLKYWAGVVIDSPCEECGAANKVTNGYGVWVQDLDDSPTHTLQAANAAAIKIDGLATYGRILWRNRVDIDTDWCSIYRPDTSGVLELRATKADQTPGVVQTASGVNFNVGGGYRVGGTEVISSGRVADFASLKIGGTQVVDSNRGLTNVQGASVNDAASPGSGAFQVGSSFSGSPKISMNTSNGNIGTLGVVNAVNGFQFNGTPGATGTFLDQNGNTVHVNGGIITSLT